MSSIKHLRYALPHSSPPFICITLHLLKGFHGGRTNSGSWRPEPHRSSVTCSWVPGQRNQDQNLGLTYPTPGSYTTLQEIQIAHMENEKPPQSDKLREPHLKIPESGNIQVAGDRWKLAAKKKAEGNFLGDMTITSHRTGRTWLRDWSGNNKGQDMFFDPGNKPPYTSSTLFSSQTTCLSFTYGTEKGQRFEFKELGEGSSLPTP